MSKRIEQVNELIRVALGKIILEEIELPLNTFVTIVSVHTAKDLKNATVYLSIIPNNKTLSTLEFLQRKIGLLQRCLGENIQLRYTPKLCLKIDYTEQAASHIEAILDKLQERQ